MRRGFQKSVNNTSNDKNKWKWEMSSDKRSETIEECIHNRGTSMPL